MPTKCTYNYQLVRHGQNSFDSVFCSYVLSARFREALLKCFFASIEGECGKAIGDTSRDRSASRNGREVFPKYFYSLLEFRDTEAKETDCRSDKKGLESC